MNNPKKIMEVALSHPEAADLTTKAAQAGIPTAEFLGIHVLASAYGVLHPEVVAFRNRPKAGVSGTETTNCPEDVQ